MEQSTMMLSTINAMTDTDPKGATRGNITDSPAAASTFKTFHRLLLRQISRFEDRSVRSIRKELRRSLILTIKKRLTALNHHSLNTC
jgi:hypothetical protein